MMNEFEKRVAGRKSFAASVENGDYVSFKYNGLIRFGRVVETIHWDRSNPTNVRGWLTLEMTDYEQDREDWNGKVPSQFKRFNWNNMTECSL